MKFRKAILKNDDLFIRFLRTFKMCEEEIHEEFPEITISECFQLLNYYISQEGQISDYIIRIQQFAQRMI